MRLNPAVRFLLASLLAVSLIGGMWFLRVQQSADADAGASGDFHLEVVGPDGSLYNGTLTVERATALRVLLEADEVAGLSVELDSYSGFGACGEYVRAIAGYEAGGPFGWVYEIEEDGNWTRPPRSSSCQPLELGQSVRWIWVDQE